MTWRWFRRDTGSRVAGSDYVPDVYELGRRGGERLGHAEGFAEGMRFAILLERNHDWGPVALQLVNEGNSPAEAYRLILNGVAKADASHLN